MKKQQTNTTTAAQAQKRQAESQKKSLSPAQTAAGRESGIALFVVMIVVLILSILVYQLTFTTKVEEVVSRNRKGFTKASYSLQSVAREVLLLLKTDWTSDLEEAADATGEDAEGGPGGLPGGAGANSGANSGDATEDENSAEEEVDTDKGYDFRREEWEVLLQKSLNEIQVEVDIQDCDSKININYIFDYVNLTPIDQNQGATPGGTGPGGDAAAAGDSAADEEEEEEEDWIPPSDEQKDAAIELFVRLIDGVVSYNQEHGFEYDVDVPSSSLMAEDAVNLILGLKEASNGEAFGRVDFLESRLSAVWWAPKPILDEDEEGENGELPEELRSSFGSEVGLDEEGLDDSSGWQETDEGFEQVPHPMGLRDLLTVYGGFVEKTIPIEGGLPGETATRKIPRLNLNTARPEVLAAILHSFEPEEATDMALEIDIYLNTLADPEEEDTSGDATNTDDTSSDSSDAEDEEVVQEAPYFTELADLDNILEEWTESGVAGEPSVIEQIKHDLERVANFRAQYFRANFAGKIGKHELRAFMIIERVGTVVRPLVWRESIE